MAQETSTNGYNVPKHVEIAPPFEVFVPSQVFWGSLLCNPFCGALMLNHNLAETGRRPYAALPLVLVALVVSIVSFAPPVVWPERFALSQTAATLFFGLVVATQVGLAVVMWVFTRITVGRIDHPKCTARRSDAARKWLFGFLCALFFWISTDYVLDNLPGLELETLSVDESLIVQYSQEVPPAVVEDLGQVLLRTKLFPDDKTTFVGLINTSDGLELMFFWTPEVFPSKDVLQPYFEEISTRVADSSKYCLNVSARDKDWNVVESFRSKSCR